MTDVEREAIVCDDESELNRFSDNASKSLAYQLHSGFSER